MFNFRALAARKQVRERDRDEAGSLYRHSIGSNNSLVREIPRRPGLRRPSSK
jgi:hypothetical protein